MHPLEHVCSPASLRRLHDDDRYTDATNPPSPHKTTLRKMADRERWFAAQLADKDAAAAATVAGQQQAVEEAGARAVAAEAALANAEAQQAQVRERETPRDC